MVGDIDELVGFFASDTDGLDDGIGGTGASGNNTGTGAIVGDTAGLVDSIAIIGVDDGTPTKSGPPGGISFPPVGPPGSISSCGCPYSPVVVGDGIITKSGPPGDISFPPVGPPGSISPCGCPYSPGFEASFCRSFNRTVTRTTIKPQTKKAIMIMIDRRL